MSKFAGIDIISSGVCTPVFGITQKFQKEGGQQSLSFFFKGFQAIPLGNNNQNGGSL